MTQLIATFLCIGYMKPAPGTWASAVAVLLGVLAYRAGFPLAVPLGAVLATLAGFWAVPRMIAGGSDSDPSEVVIDEVAGQLLAMSFTVIPLSRHGVDILAAWPGWVVPFLLFRLFDIWKPWVIGQADRRGDAAGVMLDDLWAGLFAGLLSLVLAGLYHGGHDAMTDVARQILAPARFWGLRIATAESCTGGMVAVALTDVAGSSDVFDRGFVTYSNEAKSQMLAVRAETLGAWGAVSEPVAAEMAEGALTHSQATLAVSITGIAGPGGSEFKPEGRVCFGLARQGQPTVVETVEFGALGRARVRQAARDHALALLATALV